MLHVVVNRRLRTLDIALEKLDVGLHRNRTAEIDRTALLPEKLVDELLRRLKIALALPRRRQVRRELEIHLGRLAGHVAPGVRILIRTVLAVDELEEPLVDLRRGVELLVADENLTPGVARILVKLLELLWQGLRVGELREELVIDLRALGLLAARKEVVRDLETGRPVLRAIAVRQRGDARFGLVELTQQQHAADLDGEEKRIRFGPALLGRRNHGFGQIREAALDQGLDIGDLRLEGLINLVLLGRRLSRGGLALFRKHGRCRQKRH